VNPPAKQTPSGLRRKIQARLEEVEALCADIRACLARGGMTRLSFAAELVARECLNNAVCHGSGQASGQTVSFQMRLAANRVAMRITDEGPGFDWRKKRSEPPPGECTVGGKGLAIVASHASRVSFNAKGNRIAVWIDTQREERPKPMEASTVTHNGPGSLPTDEDPHKVAGMPAKNAKAEDVHP
jgi:serine/threonine-protein kinase RsbW